MRRSLLLAIALLACTATLAPAQGLNLAWNDCGGNANKAFACNSNTATTSSMTGSYYAPAGVGRMSGNEVVIDLQSAAAVVPAWWQVRGTGHCRNGALTANVGTPGTCENDFWAGNGAGGIGAYNVSGVLTGRARLLMAFAVPADFTGPVPSDVETYAFTVNVSNVKTVGTGACAGCLTPVCIVLSSIRVTQPVGVGDFMIVDPAVRNYVTWQGGEVYGGCPQATPTKNATWGLLKSLYR